MRVPTMTDIEAAARRLAAALPPTPQWTYPVLDAAVGASVHVKHENTQPTGAFKARSGLNLLLGLDEQTRAAGVCTYSTGNHAQAIAFGAHHVGAPCLVVMPENANPMKAAAVRGWGAHVELRGATLEDAAREATRLAEDGGMRLVSPADEPDIIAGVATLYLELLRATPELDAIFVPVGSGTSAAAACLVTAELAPTCQVIGVQSDSSPAAHDSWRAGQLLRRPNRTEVEGLATGAGFALPQSVLRERLTDFTLVSDTEIRAAQGLLLAGAHTVAEGAGATALAGLWRRRDEFAGARVAIVCSGGNASLSELDALGDGARTAIGLVTR